MRFQVGIDKNPFPARIPLGSRFGVRAAIPRGFVSGRTNRLGTRRIVRGWPVGVGTDYLTDKQLYERVGQANVVYIGRKPPDLLRINLGQGEGPGGAS